VDGDFGRLTEAAVKAYQKDHDLAETGTVNEAQYEALLALTKDETATPEPTATQAATADPTGIPAVIEVVDETAKEEDKPEEQTEEQAEETVEESPVANILKKTDTPQLGEKCDFEEGIWRSGSQGTATREIVDIEDAPLEGILQGFHITDDGTSEKNSSVAMDGAPTEYQHVYVLSCYAKGSGKLYLQVGKTPYASCQFDLTDEWQQYSFAFVANDEIGSTEEHPETCVFFGIVKAEAGDATICGMMLEEAQAHAWSGSVN